MAGQFILLEGGEGSGKTTQIALLYDWLQTAAPGRNVVVTREPGGTALGQGIRKLLLEGQEIHPHAELMLFAADRAEHVESVIRPALAEGAIVLCDRYTLSTIAYQGYGRGLSQTMILQLNNLATSGLQPDLVLWLDVSVEVGLARAKQRGVNRLDEAGVRFHQKVRLGYQTLAAQYGDRMVRINADQDQQTVATQIQEQVARFLLSLKPEASPVISA